MSYTTFAYSDLKVHTGEDDYRELHVKNTGTRAGAEIAEVYAALPSAAEEPPKRLVGWSKVQLDPGESKEVSVSIDPTYLSIFDEAAEGWKLVPGEYSFMVGGSSRTCHLLRRSR